MTIDKIIKSVATLVLSTAMSCGSNKTNKGDDDDNDTTTEWPSECKIKDYVGDKCVCEDMSGIYTVHEINCNPTYSQIEIKQFPDSTSGTYNFCPFDPGCQSFIIATDVKTSQEKCLNWPNTTSSIGNNYFSGAVELVGCNDDEFIKMYTHQRECEFWLKKESESNIIYDFNKFGTPEGFEMSHEICN